MRCPFLILPVLTLLELAACTPVRTVYDENGNVVSDEPGGEKDLMATFEKRFDAAFSEQKTKDGVPMTTSSKVSAYQRDLDEARRIDKTFSTGTFDTGSRLGLRDSSYDAAAKRFQTGKSDISRTTNSMYSTALRPDFMNETHGISHNQRYAGASSTDRSQLEGLSRNDRSKSFSLTDYEPYTTDTESGYIETRRHKTKEPVIMDKQDYYRQFRGGLKGILGTDNPTP